VIRSTNLLSSPHQKSSSTSR